MFCHFQLLSFSARKMVYELAHSEGLCKRESVDCGLIACSSAFSRGEKCVGLSKKCLLKAICWPHLVQLEYDWKLIFDNESTLCLR